MHALAEPRPNLGLDLNRARRAGRQPGRMRSWVFRHRLRLRAVYGPLPVPAETPAMGARKSGPKARSGLRPGHCERKGRHFVLRPMTPPAA
jgi:hypothetical protein